MKGRTKTEVCQREEEHGEEGDSRTTQRDRWPQRTMACLSGKLWLSEDRKTQHRLMVRRGGNMWMVGQLEKRRRGILPFCNETDGQLLRGKALWTKTLQLLQGAVVSGKWNSGALKAGHGGQ
ncbi:hypothetical protein NDU88_000941 [Pleurodeles waltl]|uniref:Uncharacterized protein n=1 Tax=Pleurodeles waltl TaxID=8319 RepID=A0AAV7WGX4_PLEWA|nr:hypothetical protein NDU88_000941 [Pleurodeles waltl]